MMNDSTMVLGPLIEPAPVAFTFEAPGWKITGLVLLLAAIVVVVLWWIHYRKNKYRRIALQMLQQEEETVMTSKKYVSLIYMANMLMKRIGMQRYGREKVASLRGKEWLDFLNKTSSSDSFNKEDEDILASLYIAAETLDEAQAKTFCNKTKHWIKKHKYVFRSL